MHTRRVETGVTLGTPFGLMDSRRYRLSVRDYPGAMGFYRPFEASYLLRYSLLSSA